jgi:hypothetical protein
MEMPAIGMNRACIAQRSHPVCRQVRRYARTGPLDYGLQASGRQVEAMPTSMRWKRRLSRADQALAYPCPSRGARHTRILGCTSPPVHMRGWLRRSFPLPQQHTWLPCPCASSSTGTSNVPAHTCQRVWPRLGTSQQGCPTPGRWQVAPMLPWYPRRAPGTLHMRRHRAPPPCLNTPQAGASARLGALQHAALASAAPHPRPHARLRTSR